MPYAAPAPSRRHTCGDYRLPHDVRDRLAAALAPFRNRDTVFTLATVPRPVPPGRRRPPFKMALHRRHGVNTHTGFLKSRHMAVAEAISMMRSPAPYQPGTLTAWHE